MFREILEGLYNNFEVPLLDIKWTLLAMIRRFKVKDVVLDTITAECVHIMPQAMMLKFSDFRGSIVWKYEIIDGRVAPYKGWRATLKLPRFESDLERIIIDAHEKLAYDEIDNILKS